eukprot:3354-Heterococcus_DN1.PRE.1
MQQQRLPPSYAVTLTRPTQSNYERERQLGRAGRVCPLTLDKVLHINIMGILMFQTSVHALISVVEECWSLLCLRSLCTVGVRSEDKQSFLPLIVHTCDRISVALDAAAERKRIVMALIDADGREYGLGVVVGRNIDRGDAKNIPHHQLELCE